MAGVHADGARALISQKLGLVSRSLIHSGAWQMWTSAEHDCQGSCICTTQRKDTGVEVVRNPDCPVIGHAGVVRSVAFSPDGNRVVSASEDNMVKIWDTETGAEVISLVGVHLLWRGDAGGVLAFLAGLALSVV